MYVAFNVMLPDGGSVKHAIDAIETVISYLRHVQDYLNKILLTNKITRKKIYLHINKKTL